MTRQLVAVGAVVLIGAMSIATDNAFGQVPPVKSAGQNKPRAAHVEFLEDAELAPGILRVNAYLGERDRPLVNTVITVHPAGGEPLVARTDAQGVTTVPNLKPGSKYRVEARINNESYVSKQFSLPTKTGLSLSLSPTPPKKARAGSGSGDGRPNPSRMHGIPRGQEGDASGTLTVRVLRGSWNHNAAKIKVHLVGYHSSGKVTMVTKVTDLAGRVRFTKLDRSRNTAYYAFAMLARLNKDGAALKEKPHEGYDRLTSRTIQLPPKVGARMVLSGSTPNDTSSAWDNNRDMFGDRSWDSPKAGEVHVEVNGTVTNSMGTLELIKVGSPDVVAVATVTKGSPRARAVKLGRARVFPMASSPVGTVYFQLARSQNLGSRSAQPIPTATVQLVDSSTNATVAPRRVLGSVTEFSGLKPGGIYSWSVSAFGTTLTGSTFEVDETKGAFIPVPMDYQTTSAYSGVFKGVVGGDDSMYIARARRGKELYQSRPFQLTPTKGAFTKIDLGERIRYAFEFQGELDDNRIIFQGQFIVANVSWFPYRTKSGRYIFDLPKGFKGATVHGGMSAVVKEARGKGFAWSGAIPPRGTSFRGAWVMLVDQGEMRFDLDLPNGAVNSRFQLKQLPGMKVKAHGNIQGKPFKDGRGNMWFALDNLSIAAGQAIVLDVSGLPQPPSYHRYLRWAAGVTVLLLLIFALVSVFRSSHSLVSSTGRSLGRLGRSVNPAAALNNRREALLDKLVALEQKHASNELEPDVFERGKAALIDELETVYQKIEQAKAGAAASS